MNKLVWGAGLLPFLHQCWWFDVFSFQPESQLHQKAVLQISIKVNLCV